MQSGHYFLNLSPSPQTAKRRVALNSKEHLRLTHIESVNVIKEQPINKGALVYLIWAESMQDIYPNGTNNNKQIAFNPK